MCGRMEVGVRKEGSLVLFISQLKNVKNQKSWYKRHMNLVSVGLRGANSTVNIYNQNVTTSSLATFREANLSIWHILETTYSTLY